MEYKRLTKQNKEPKTIFCFSGSMQDFKIYKRLQELEDKIENGTLKKEMTCKNVSEMHPTDGFTCSECGKTIIDFREEIVDEEDCTASWYEYEMKYCPNCGAKVVQNG